MSLCVLLFKKKKVQSNATVVRAAGEEKFGGHRARQLTCQQLARAVLHPSFGSGLRCDRVSVSSSCLVFLT